MAHNQEFGNSQAVELRLINRALREEWAISDEARAKAVDVAVSLLNDPSPYIRLSAVRTLGLLDSLNAKRERNAVESRNGEIAAAASVVRASLASANRQGLANLTARICQSATINSDLTDEQTEDGGSKPSPLPQTLPVIGEGGLPSS